jgi:hypothetical protein
MIKWFAANNLVLNLDKTNIMKFITKNSSHSTLHIGCKENYIEETVNTATNRLKKETEHLGWNIFFTDDTEGMVTCRFHFQVHISVPICYLYTAHELRQIQHQFKLL